MRLATSGLKLLESTEREENAGEVAAALIEANSELMTLFFRHIAVCPPHGPFKYYSAITFTERVRRWIAANGSERNVVTLQGLTPTAVLHLMEKYYNTNHLRSWPLLYVPAEIRLKDVLALLGEEK
ncbi:hypothetical protein C3747_6g2242c [Trypanosoma cruzi]|uniref:Uncharacterized protein n=2 Tax=Trypanosoma cruzi TaxID=5693 RepID=Q4D3J9_TRYCC|nr:hypothetical protein, conserved [Trypanosoma cruzi]EAN87101.1 hypothetical protein, conserved [Trypanosoma cruzi]PWV20532.1 hypothetical protein C3747_6g2242c [Trypanosoma cruzi]RNC46314.1 hypothetical protein TcCL_NonESM03874 [Trypanosoma cruzi]|eukprot:XP_808952.1 hypothetical protein [Trypanosoma cruzi strain CL Brener]